MEFAFQRSEFASQFQHACSTGGVVVGARMDLSDLIWSKGGRIATAEVIVVSADNDIFIGLAGKVGKNIVDGGAKEFDVDFQGEMQIVGKGKRVGLVRLVDLIL